MQGAIFWERKAKWKMRGFREKTEIFEKGFRGGKRRPSKGPFLTDRI